MENAEVLEMTVKRVENILQNKAKGKNSCYQVSYRPALKKKNDLQCIWVVTSHRFSPPQKLTA